MPYIYSEDRPPIDRLLAASRSTPENKWASLREVRDMQAGELAYLLFRIFDQYTEENFCYARAAELVGVVETSLAEWRRRRLDPYEDKKREVHGDV